MGVSFPLYSFQCSLSRQTRLWTRNTACSLCAHAYAGLTAMGFAATRFYQTERGAVQPDIRRCYSQLLMGIQLYGSCRNLPIVIYFVTLWCIMHALHHLCPLVRPSCHEPLAVLSSCWLASAAVVISFTEMTFVCRTRRRGESLSWQGHPSFCSLCGSQPLLAAKFDSDYSQTVVVYFCSFSCLFVRIVILFGWSLLL